jgi:hypothetical protein
MSKEIDFDTFRRCRTRSWARPGRQSEREITCLRTISASLPVRRRRLGVYRKAKETGRGHQP